MNEATSPPAVPEPATAALLLAGCGLIGGVAVGRRQRVARLAAAR